MAIKMIQKSSSLPEQAWRYEQYVKTARGSFLLFILDYIGKESHK